MRVVIIFPFPTIFVVVLVMVSEGSLLDVRLPCGASGPALLADVGPSVLVPIAVHAARAAVGSSRLRSWHFRTLSSSSG